ncbi:bcl-2-like protein 1 [Takifugu flavidus]|uniref:bcl-2-like protein 1 n=1 Tax=Takifugu flavidus TaxID=433684 RepID=UPI0025442150|nr:bcl-2-like protein 1 [Takifugu flavidus]
MSNRELVENYLIYKLSQKYPGTVSPPAGTGREALNAVLRSMANKYEQDFMEQAGDLSPYVAVTRNKAGFNKVMDDMFRDEINWGTVVGLFVVGGATYVQSFEGGASEPVCHVADWMTDYLDQRINPWIESQGGWDCFVTIYGEDACTNRAQEDRRKWILGGLVVLAGVLIIVTKNYGTLRKAFSNFMSYWS